MSRLIRTRRWSKYKRRPLGDGEKYLQDVFRKPILTARDKDVLLSLYYHRCLTTEQIADIHFRYNQNGNVNSQSLVIARRRLRKLFDYTLVDRFFVEMPDGQGTSQSHFVLDTLGAKVVAGLLNEPLNRLKWRYDMDEARLPYLSHMVSINEFYVRMLAYARAHGHDVGSFLVEHHVRHEFTWRDRPMIFNPDAYGQYWFGEEGIHFFLEWDNGTMSPLTFQKKHNRYTAFYDSDIYRSRYETFPLILTVAPDRERVHALAKTIRDVDATDNVWLFTAEKDLKEGDFRTIWVDKHENPATLW